MGQMDCRVLIALPSSRPSKDHADALLFYADCLSLIFLDDFVRVHVYHGVWMLLCPMLALSSQFLACSFKPEPSLYLSIYYSNGLMDSLFSSLVVYISFEFNYFGTQITSHHFLPG